MTNPLGEFLQDRRKKLDPASLGYPLTRRRTPGLRREEVAQRANVSATWYTWLEQGRGGAPSADVLDRLARGLALTEVEREHLFLLAQNRPPEVKQQESSGITPQLQRVLDAFEFTPAFVRTAEWDVVAGNRAALTLWANEIASPQDRFNILERFFSNPDNRDSPHWEGVARSIVAGFRTETARAGFSQRAQEVVDTLCRVCPQFPGIWQDHALVETQEGVKTFAHTPRGEITFEYSTFVVDGSTRLRLVVFNPVSPEDRDRVRSLLG
jgi:transcriptional regulator with XRE-family HTH domain